MHYWETGTMDEAAGQWTLGPRSDFAQFFVANTGKRASSGSFQPWRRSGAFAFS